jgi:hypothetical protein
MNRKEELNAIILEAKNELWKIEEIEEKEKNKLFVGKFFKYHNCYSCPEPEDYWWQYTAVEFMEDDGGLVSWNFEKDMYGKIEIETKTSFQLLDNHIEISEEEFYVAYESMIMELELLMK